MKMTIRYQYVLIVVMFFILPAVSVSQQEIGKYAVAISNTPVLNTSDFESVFGGVNGTSVKLDNKGLIREMEFIAFPGTVFEILEVIPKNGHSMFRVMTSDYQYNSDLYIDSRFVNVVDAKPEERSQVMPSKEQIIQSINALDGYGYMWGGNYGDGISKLLEYYQPQNEISSKEKDLWSLKGVDCSGLIYQATNGSTPRNTSSLTTYGQGVEISGMSASEIASQLQPLDLIVWAGHVIIVLDDSTVIESTPDYGVHKSDLITRLKSVMNERKPVNEWSSSNAKRFVIRRWL